MTRPDLSSCTPFLIEGQVSLLGSDLAVPVTILRDTGAYDSFILSSVLPFSSETDTGLSIPVLGMGMSVFHVPVHQFMLKSGLFDGVVLMGVRPALPVEGVTLILGNGVAGEKRSGLFQPERPLVNNLDIAVSTHDLFQACAVTRAMSAATGAPLDQVCPDGDPNPPHCFVCLFYLCLSQSDLVGEQRADPSLQPFFQSVQPLGEMKNRAYGCLVQNGVLLRVGYMQ